MGRQRSVSIEDFSKMQRKEKIAFLKDHPLLRTCSKDKPESLPKVGELVWARVLNSVFWPGFILQLTDVECNEEGAEDIDDTAYGFVMFLESTYRHAPVAWDQMIPFEDMETQMKLVPHLNKLIIRKGWKQNTLYRTALEMAREFSRIPVLERYNVAVSRYEERKKSVRAQSPVKTKTPTTSDPLSPLKSELPPEEAISKVMSAVREKKKSGIRVSERITKKQIVKLKPKPQPKNTATKKTENTNDDKAAAKNSKINNKNHRNSRPETGGEILKQWTRDRFNAFSKQYTFESSNSHCGECNTEITAEQTVKTCHNVPYHIDCLTKQGEENVKFKCQMCINHQCFLCKIPSDKAHPAYKCSRCELRFHIDCLLKDWPQAEIQGSSGPITCPLHFCHTCLGEQKIYGKFRDYTASSSRSYKCRICLSNYHKTCLPAGCGESIQGKEFIVCPKHTLPELKVQQRRIGCLACYKPLKPKEEKVECSYCIQAFHPECVGYVGEIKNKVSLEVFGQGYKCYSCRWGLFPLYGQVVWFQQPQSQYWPARILFPAEYKYRKNFAKRLPGQYSIEYFGSTSFYDNASRALPLHLTTVEIFKTMKVYQEVPKILRAHEEAAFCFMFSEEYRDKQLAEPKPVYKKIEKNVYRTVTVQKVREPSDVCSCSEEKSEFVCQADSGCTNRDMEMECSDRICKGGSRCCNRMFSERKNDEEFLEKKLFLNKGWGVIAKKPFKPGDFVAEYRGEVIDRNEMKWRLSKKEEEDPMYILEISKEFFIDAEYVGNLSRLINHSCDPNCEVRKYLSMGRSVGGIFARRPINVGEEVTFRYGCGSQSTAPFRCRCGARNCTVFVGKDVPENYMVEDDPEQNQDKWDDVCSKCGFGGRVICCEFPACGKVWHYQCVGLSRQPRKNWCCPEHPAKKVDQLKKAIESRNKTSKSKNANGNGKPSSNNSMVSIPVKSPATPQQQTKKKMRQSAPATQTASSDATTSPTNSVKKTEIVKSQEKKRPSSDVLASPTNELLGLVQKGKQSLSTISNDEVSQTVQKKMQSPSTSSTEDSSQPVQKRRLSITSSDEVPQSTQKRKLSVSTPSSLADEIQQPVRKRQCTTTTSPTTGKSSTTPPHQPESTPVHPSGRNLRSSKILSPTKARLSVEIPVTPSKSKESETFSMMQKTLETPTPLPKIRPTAKSRRRRANSIPPNGISFTVPSTPITRSKRSRRGESMHECISLSKKVESCLCLETPSKSDALPDRTSLKSLSFSLLDTPRRTRRRSRSHKTLEPFSPLVLNPYVPPREPPPVNISSTLIPSDKHVRMGTRSTAGTAYSESPFHNQVNGQAQATNGVCAGDSPVVAVTEIKQEPYDNAYEEDAILLEQCLDETRRKNFFKTRLPFDHDTDSASLGSFSLTDEDSDLEIMQEFTNPFTQPRSYSGDTFPV